MDDTLAKLENKHPVGGSVHGHDRFDELGDRLTRPPLNQQGNPMWTGGSVSWVLLGEVLSRVAVNTPPVTSRAAVVNGDMLRVKLPLSEGSVSKATTSLIAREFLLEDPDADLSGGEGGRAGRPRTPIRLNYTRWFVIGVHVDERPDTSVTLTAIATTIDDRLLTEPYTADIPPAAPDASAVKRGAAVEHGAALVDAITGLVTEILKDERIRQRRVGGDTGWLPWLGLGVAVGNPVFDGKMLGRSQKPFNLGKELVDALNIPVVVENDAAALAVRATYGADITEPDFALVLVADAGVGAAFAVGGRVYRGSQGMAGEIGHIKVTPPAPFLHAGGRNSDPADDESTKCRCDHPDHVDVYATPYRLRQALARRFTELDEAARASAGEDLDQLLPLLLHRLSDKDAREVGELFHAAGQVLGEGIAAMIDVVNPAQLVIVMPPAFQASDDDLDSVRAIKNRHGDGIANELGQIFSRRQEDADRDLVWTFDSATLAKNLARAAAIRVFIEFIDHLCGLDGCPPVPEGTTIRRVSTRDIVVPVAGALARAAVGAVVGGAIGSAFVIPFAASATRMNLQKRSQTLEQWSKGRRTPTRADSGKLGDQAALTLSPYS